MRRLVQGMQGKPALFDSGLFIFSGGKEGRGARCKVQGARCAGLLPFLEGPRAPLLDPGQLCSWICRSQHADAGACSGGCRSGARKFCPAEIGRGGGNLRSSDVRAECKIDIGRVREMLLRLSFQRYGCASFHHHYQWRALN